MNGFWLGFYEVCNVLMIVAGIAFFAMIAYIVVTALSLKTTVMRDAKRLYEPPLSLPRASLQRAKALRFKSKCESSILAHSSKSWQMMSKMQ
jgi:hypothetical protein